MSVYVIDPTKKVIKVSSIGVHTTGGGSPKFKELVEGTIQTIEQTDLKDITSIRNNVFADLSIESVDIPSNVTAIGDSAFANNNITTLSLGQGVTTIGDSAFQNNSISTVTIPASVTTIGDSAFEGNVLTEITMESDTPPVVTSTTFPDTLQTTNVSYNGYPNYESDSNWQTYKDTLVRGLAIPSTITVIVNNYLNELVSGASVIIEGNGQTFTGTTNENGVFVQGDLQPATYTVSVADIDGFKSPEPNTVQIVVEENTQNSATFTYLEKPSIILFADATPQEIANISQQISANNMTSSQVAETFMWNLGDTKDITLSTGEVIQMQIIGFNHDNKSDGSGKAGITLQMKNCLNTTYTMNASNTNSGGYANSVMKTSTLPTIKASLPQSWQDVIKLVDKKSANGGGSNYSQILTLSEDIFLLSAIEVFGSANNYGYAQAGAYEGSRYEYWSISPQSGRVKTVGDTANAWRLRSCGNSSTRSFCSVSNLGNADNDNASVPRGISFAFCV